jgi:hypothetical protein
VHDKNGIPGHILVQHLIGEITHHSHPGPDIGFDLFEFDFRIYHTAAKIQFVWLNGDSPD